MPLYEGKAVYFDHSEGNKNRKYTDRIGNLKNVKVQASGLFADLQINPKHQLAESVMWDFANNSKDVGLSHEAEGDMVNGRCVNLTAVKAICLCCNPATTLSLREEQEAEVQKTQSEIEAVKKSLSETLTTLNEIRESNTKLMVEIQDLKAKKPISHNPMPEPPASEQQTDIQSWVSNLKTRRKF